MHPELITLPGGFSIKTYGFFLTIGFLSAVWLAMRRAAKVRVDVDKVLDASFLALIGGVVGARIFYVAHYWRPQFADASNKFLAIVDIRQGGLEYLGGFFGAMALTMIYVVRKRQSLRLFLDVLAPSVMWGVAIGRIGCFFNGCCFGGLCELPGHQYEPRYLWAVQFPYQSPAQLDQWDERLVTVPAELLVTGKNILEPWLVPQGDLEMSPEKRDGPKRAYRDAAAAVSEAEELAASPEETARLKGRSELAKKSADEHESKLAATRLAQAYPSRITPVRKTLVSELEDLAGLAQSRPIHPVQLYASIHGFLLAGLLSAVFYRRKRHGVVIGLLFVLYPFARIFEEMIRVDNPQTAFGLTISQHLSLAMLLGGSLFLIVLYTRLPERSPLAEAAAPKVEESQT